MKHISETENMLILRTDFSDPTGWQAICKAIMKPYRDVELTPTLNFLSDPEYNQMTPQQVLSLISESYSHSAIFIVDERTISEAEHSVLVMKLSQDIYDEGDEDVYLERGSTFRIPPSWVFDIEVNLTLANVDFDEYAESVDDDGILRRL